MAEHTDYRRLQQQQDRIEGLTSKETTKSEEAVKHYCQEIDRIQGRAMDVRAEALMHIHSDTPRWKKLDKACTKAVEIVLRFLGKVDKENFLEQRTAFQDAVDDAITSLEEEESVGGDRLAKVITDYQSRSPSAWREKTPEMYETIADTVKMGYLSAAFSEFGVKNFAVYLQKFAKTRAPKEYADKDHFVRIESKKILDRLDVRQVGLIKKRIELLSRLPKELKSELREKNLLNIPVPIIPALLLSQMLGGTVSSGVYRDIVSDTFDESIRTAYTGMLEGQYQRADAIAKLVGEETQAVKAVGEAQKSSDESPEDLQKVSQAITAFTEAQKVTKAAKQESALFSMMLKNIDLSLTLYDAELSQVQGKTEDSQRVLLSGLERNYIELLAIINNDAIEEEHKRHYRAMYKKMNAAFQDLLKAGKLTDFEKGYYAELLKGEGTSIETMTHAVSVQQQMALELEEQLFVHDQLESSATVRFENFRLRRIHIPEEYRSEEHPESFAMVWTCAVMYPSSSLNRSHGINLTNEAKKDFDLMTSSGKKPVFLGELNESGRTEREIDLNIYDSRFFGYQDADGTFTQVNGTQIAEDELPAGAFSGIQEQREGSVSFSLNTRHTVMQYPLQWRNGSVGLEANNIARRRDLVDISLDGVQYKCVDISNIYFAIVSQKAPAGMTLVLRHPIPKRPPSFTDKGERRGSNTNDIASVSEADIYTLQLADLAYAEKLPNGDIQLHDLQFTSRDRNRADLSDHDRVFYERNRIAKIFPHRNYGIVGRTEGTVQEVSAVAARRDAQLHDVLLAIDGDEAFLLAGSLAAKAGAVAEQLQHIYMGGKESEFKGNGNNRQEEFVNFARGFVMPLREEMNTASINLDAAKTRLIALRKRNFGSAQSHLESEIDRRIAKIDTMVKELNNKSKGSFRYYLDQIANATDFDANTWWKWMRDDLPEIALGIGAAVAIFALSFVGGSGIVLGAALSSTAGFIGAQAGRELSYWWRAGEGAWGDDDSVDYIQGGSDAGSYLREEQKFNPTTGRYESRELWEDVLDPTVQQLAMDFGMQLASMGGGRFIGSHVAKTLARSKWYQALTAADSLAMKRVIAVIGRCKARADAITDVMERRAFTRFLARYIDEILEEGVYEVGAQHMLASLHNELGQASSMSLVALQHCFTLLRGRHAIRGINFDLGTRTSAEPTYTNFESAYQALQHEGYLVNVRVEGNQRIMDVFLISPQSGNPDRVFTVKPDSTINVNTDGDEEDNNDGEGAVEVEGEDSTTRTQRTALARYIQECRRLRRQYEEVRTDTEESRKVVAKLEEQIGKLSTKLGRLENSILSRIWNLRSRRKLRAEIDAATTLHDIHSQQFAQLRSVEEDISVLLQGRETVAQDRALLDAFHARQDHEYQESMRARQVEEVCAANNVLCIHGFSEYIPQGNSPLMEDGRVDMESKLQILLGFQPNISVSTIQEGDTRRNMWENRGVILIGGTVDSAAAQDAGTVFNGIHSRGKISESSRKAMVQDPAGTIQAAIEGRSSYYNELTVSQPQVAALYFTKDDYDLDQVRELERIGQQYGIPVYCLENGKPYTYSHTKQDHIDNHDYSHTIYGIKTEAEVALDTMQPYHSLHKGKVLQEVLDSLVFDPKKLGIEDAASIEVSEEGSAAYTEIHSLMHPEKHQRTEAYTLWPGEYRNSSPIPIGAEVSVVGEFSALGGRKQYLLYDKQVYVRIHSRTATFDKQFGAAAVRVVEVEGYAHSFGGLQDVTSISQVFTDMEAHIAELKSSETEYMHKLACFLYGMAHQAEINTDTETATRARNLAASLGNITLNEYNALRAKRLKDGSFVMYPADLNVQYQGVAIASSVQEAFGTPKQQEAVQNLKQYFLDHATDITVEERLSIASTLLGRGELTPIEQQRILDSHKKPGVIGELTPEQLAAKVAELRNKREGEKTTITEAERRLLIECGVCGWGKKKEVSPKMSADTTVNTPQKLAERLLSEMNPDFVKSADRLKFLEGHLELMREQEMANNPELALAYQKIFIERDHEFLRQKSAKQVAAMQKKFLGQVGKTNLIGRNRLHKKLSIFRSWIQQMHIVRADVAAEKHNEFLAPNQVGRASSYTEYDAAIRAEHYVYCTLEGIPHDMGAGGTPVDMTGRDGSQLVMMDISKQNDRHNRTNDTMNSYINNIFDLKNGQEMLALYLAYSFDTPEQAAKWIEQNNSASGPQNWHKGWLYDAELGRPDESMMSAIDRMKELNDAMHLEPPLNMEVRIPDRVSVLQGPEQDVIHREAIQLAEDMHNATEHKDEASQKLVQFLQYKSINPNIRLQLAQIILGGTNLTPLQQERVMLSHNLPGYIGRLTLEQKFAKGRMLMRDNVFSRAEAQLLLDCGICGHALSPPPPSIATKSKSMEVDQSVPHTITFDTVVTDSTLDTRGERHDISPSSKKLLDRFIALQDPKITVSANSNKIVVHISGTDAKGEHVNGNIECVRDPSGQVMVVESSTVSKGYGPIVYDVAMEVASAYGIPIVSDRKTVSDDAYKVWQQYYLRDDIQHANLPPGLWYMGKKADSKFETMTEDESSWPNKSDPIWSLWTGYSKKPEILPSIRNLGLLDENIDLREE